jgi:hypothetical protein
MKVQVRLRKVLSLLAFSSILLGIECPPIVVQSFKTGTVNWVSGDSSTSTSSSQLEDYIIGLFTTPSTST